MIVVLKDIWCPWINFILDCSDTEMVASLKIKPCNTYLNPPFCLLLIFTQRCTFFLHENK